MKDWFNYPTHLAACFIKGLGQWTIALGGIFQHLGKGWRKITCPDSEMDSAPRKHSHIGQVNENLADSGTGALHIGDNCYAEETGSWQNPCSSGIRCGLKAAERVCLHSHRHLMDLQRCAHAI